MRTLAATARIRPACIPSRWARPDAAEVAVGDAGRWYERHLGPTHPHVDLAAEYRAWCCTKLGRYPKAAALYEKALCRGRHLDRSGERPGGRHPRQAGRGPQSSGGRHLKWRALECPTRAAGAVVLEDLGRRPVEHA